MKDFLKRDLKVGDMVVHGVGGRYGGLDGPYYVHSFSPKQVRLHKQKDAEVAFKCVPSSNLVLVSDV